MFSSRITQRLDESGQSGMEALLIAGVVIILAATLGSYYTYSADITTAIIILKTELLKEMSKLDAGYRIVGSLEPTVDQTGKLVFNVETCPSALPLNNGIIDLDTIEQKIASKTKYKTVEINLVQGASCA